MSIPLSRRQPEELIDLSYSRRCHVVGVGGPGMSPLASLLAARGHVVTGSDMRDSQVIETLRGEGIPIAIGHDADLIKDVDVVTYSTAIPMTNVEIVAAQDAGVSVRHRSGLLASICASTEGIGIAGTHGKTTTTGLLSHILIDAGMDPSCIVGGHLEGMPVGARHGAGNFFILECDESDGTLDVLPLTHLVITNVDIDHLDYFGSFEQLQQTFVDAATRTRGIVVLNSDDALSAPIVDAMKGDRRLHTFGHGETDDVHLISVTPDSAGIVIYFRIDGAKVECRSPLRGEHNAMNIAGAIAMSIALGVDVSLACQAVETFHGVQRRFTERGDFNGSLLVDDYAHLPAEIEAAIATARTHPRVSGKTIAVFQPNRFHRIAAMADSYAHCFTKADVIVITDVYASGTAFIEGVTGELVVNAIRAAHPSAAVVWAPTRQDIVDAVAGCITPGDICISMGCGDIETFPDDLMKAGAV